MKLSEAIRLGAMNTPQARETYRDVATGATCAVGAAFDAIGQLDALMQNPIGSIGRYFPALHEECKRTCPKCGIERAGVSSVVFHLNDDHRWTREQIADWVESVELAQESTSAESTPVPVTVRA